MNDCTTCTTNQPTRRGLLRSLAAGLAAIGLTVASSKAEAATKKYAVCKTTAVKVGSAQIFEPASGKPVLITQPKAGVFRAFSIYCTHEKVVLGYVSGNNIVCGKHGAKFDTTTGKVTKGPARTAIKQYTCTVSSGQVYVTL